MKVQRIFNAFKIRTAVVTFILASVVFAAFLLTIYMPCHDNYTMKNKTRLNLLDVENREPLGMMYMLVRKLDFNKGSKLYTTLDNLKTNFLPNNNYPLLIFYDNLDADSTQNATKSTIAAFLNGTKVIFRQTNFKLPSSDINILQFDKINPYHLGYRYMCRFHAIQAMQLQEFDNVKFILRLDDDSLILSPYKKDIFKYFDKANLEYGFAIAFGDARAYMKHFYNFTSNYIKVKNISTTFFDLWDEEDVVYNNFELSRVSFWRRKDVKDYLKAVDDHGGIFYHRWGDAPIKTLALSMFMPWLKIHCFTDIHYRHQSHEHKLESKLCTYNVAGGNRHYKDQWLKKNASNPVKRIFGIYS